MKIVLKNTHVNVEICPEDIPDEVLEQLTDAIRHGWPVSNDVVDTIIRNCRNNALAHGHRGSVDKQKG
jgi:hypothetical protein